VIVGLGNPGAKYRITRHNAGFIILDKLNIAGRWLSRPALPAQLSQTVLADEIVELVKPMAFMNRSGLVLSRLKKRWPKLTPAEVLLVYDDLDLLLGHNLHILSPTPDFHSVWSV
jgi:PTH1 family peptidyl-tRNA hydrolase